MQIESRRIQSLSRNAIILTHRTWHMALHYTCGDDLPAHEPLHNVRRIDWKQEHLRSPPERLICWPFTKWIDCTTTSQAVSRILISISNWEGLAFQGMSPCSYSRRKCKGFYIKSNSYGRKISMSRPSSNLFEHSSLWTSCEHNQTLTE